MKSVQLALCILLVSPGVAAYAGRQILPAGSLISCTISEPRLSSKTAAVGDPVLCQVGMMSRVGPSHLPFDSYMEGRFEAYKDPGHFVGKGWMELKFDRMVIEPETVVPISARVVDAPGYIVDKHGRILGKGHRTRDIVEWSLPLLWPIDVLNLPRRGPRPTLKSETRLTLKVMEDAEIPTGEDQEKDPYGLYRRGPNSSVDIPRNPAATPEEPGNRTEAYVPPPSPPEPRYKPAAPVYEPPPAYQAPPRPEYVPDRPAYRSPIVPGPVVYEYVPPPVFPGRVYWYAPPPPTVPMWARRRAVIFYPMANPYARGMVPYAYVR